MEGLWTFINSHEALAAWVQSIGTLVALGIAVWLPRREEKARLLRERNAIYDVAVKAEKLLIAAENAGATTETALAYHDAYPHTEWDIASKALDKLPVLSEYVGNIETIKGVFNAAFAKVENAHGYAILDAGPREAWRRELANVRASRRIVLDEISKIMGVTAL